MEAPKKLTLEHLAPYLPYGLKCQSTYFDKHIITELFGYNYDNEYQCIFKECNTRTEGVQPILRPLSDLDSTEGFSLSKMITHGYHNAFWCEENFKVTHLYYHDLLILLQHHFDVFGLIEKGLALSIHDVK